MVDKQQFEIGDRVCFTMGTSTICGQILNDRGPIGFNGTRIYQVLIPNDPYEDEIIEMPADSLSRASDDEFEITTDAKIEYFVDGGLLRILKQNQSGGKKQPRVWLALDTADNVIHTFIENRGIIGGETIPPQVLHENKIFTPKIPIVTEFLQSFGLSLTQAKKIIKKVGASPIAA